MSLRVVTKDELAAILAAHAKWCAGDGGSRANLRGADLRGANLRGADLRGADLLEANLRGADLLEADLLGANLRGANLRGANLRWADLRGANLRGANLRWADLLEANLRGADLRGADLSEANLRGADLRGADLREADLLGANLRGADLRGADLRGADLSAIRDDLGAVLSAAPAEVPGLLQALRDGRVNGSTYEGACACLVGTLANVRGCTYREIPNLRPNSSRPAEMWFLGINQGDTPATNQIAKITEGWIVEWLAAQPTQAVTP